MLADIFAADAITLPMQFQRFSRRLAATSPAGAPRSRHFCQVHLILPRYFVAPNAPQPLRRAQLAALKRLFGDQEFRMMLTSDRLLIDAAADSHARE